MRRFKANDATVEKLGDMLVHNTLGMLVYRDELTGLLASWEKEGKEGDKAFYLEGWNGTGSFNIDRITAVRRVSQRLAQGKLPDGFTLRDLMRKQWSGVNTMLQAESVLAALEESGHVQAAEDLNTLGRPTVRYYINPKLKRTGT